MLIVFKVALYINIFIRGYSLTAARAPCLLPFNIIVRGDLEGTAFKSRRARLLASVDFLQQVLKGVLDPSVRHSACFHEHHALVVLAA